MDDIIAFNLYHYEHSPTTRRQMYWMRYIWPVVIALLIIAIGSLAGLAFWSTGAGLAVILVWVIFFPKLLRRELRSRMRSYLLEGGNAAMIGKRTLSLDPDSIVETSDAGENKTRWSAVEKIVKHQDVIYIYISAVFAHAVPRRAFETDAEFNRFFETARELKAQSAG